MPSRHNHVITGEPLIDVACGFIKDVVDSLVVGAPGTEIDPTFRQDSIRRIADCLTVDPACVHREEQAKVLGTRLELLFQFINGRTGTKTELFGRGGSGKIWLI